MLSPRAPGRSRLPLRIALYSHDAMGMGHLRRNLLIAQTLAAALPRATILLASGAVEARAFALPPGVDCLTLPGMKKDLDEGGRYQPRRLSIPTRQLLALRADALRASLLAFAPDVLIVDKQPLGMLDELAPALEALRAAGGTRLVLGLREVLDEPAVVRREWLATGAAELARQLYDAVWVYGDPAVYDPLQEYGLQAVLGEKTRYTGYLCQPPRPVATPGERAALRRELRLPQERLLLCQVGGGEDGAQVAEAFAAAPLPEGAGAVLLTGPFMDAGVRARLQAQAARSPSLRVLSFVPDPGALLGAAERVVTMGGYNTVCEVLAAGKRSLVVPRVHPRREQLIRAERLERLGALDVLAPADATPAAVSAWLHSGLSAHAGVRPRIDLGGVHRLPGLLLDVLPAHNPRRRASARGAGPTLALGGVQ